MRFPTVCYDGFYKDPDSIVDFALSLDYHSDLGRYPGCRTKCLSKIDKNLYHSCMHKFLSMFDDFDEPNIGIIGQTSFQKTWRFSNKKEHPVNKGWIHKDGALVAAVVYLSKNPDPNSGTSIFKRKFGEETPPLPIVSGEVLGMEKQVDVNSIKEYERSLIENNKSFNVQMEVKNAYNRIICYDGEQDHTQTNYWMSDEDFRLTQVFFVKDIDCFAKKIPSMRCNRYGI